MRDSEKWTKTRRRKEADTVDGRTRSKMERGRERERVERGERFNVRERDRSRMVTAGYTKHVETR